MDIKTYKSIRQKPNFLYLYFKESGGQSIPEGAFLFFLNMWMQGFGHDPRTGITTIVNFLDKKHN